MKFRLFLNCFCGISCASLMAEWTPATQIFPGQQAFLNIVTSAYDPGAQTLVAFWINSSGSIPVASVSTNHGINWQMPVVISGMATASTLQPCAAFDNAHQTLVAAWTFRNASLAISAGSTDGGNSWGSTHQVPGSSVISEFVYPLYDINRSSLLVTWSDLVSTLPQAAISTDGGTSWGSPITIASSSNVLGSVFTSYDPTSGNITATWREMPQNTPISSVSGDGGTTWSTTPIQISSDTVESPNIFCIYNPVHKTTVATWVDAAGNLPTAAISLDDGKTWSSARTISASVNAMTGIDVFTCVDPTSGIMIAVWSASASSLPYYSFSQDGGITWDTAQTISPTAIVDSIFVIFDPVTRSFVATWGDSIPMYSIFALPPLPTLKILENQGGNIGRLASYLNSLAATSPELLDPLLSLTPGELKDALTTIFAKPSIRFSAANTLLVMSDIFAQRSMEYAALRRLKNTAPSVSTLFENKNDLLAYGGEGTLLWLSQPRNIQASTQELPHGSAQTALHKRDKYALWAEGLGEFAHQDKNDQLPSFNTTTGGALAGFDYYWANGSLSSAFGYANSQVKSSMEHDEIDFYALSIYGIGYIGNGFIEMGIWGVYNQYNQNRHISFPGFNEHAKAKFNGWQYAPHLRSGYDFACGKHWILEPFVGTDCAFIFQDGFSEHGAAPYNIRQKHTSSELLRASSGLNIYSCRDQSWGAWIVRATLAYLYKKGFHFKQREAIVDEPFGFSVIAYETAQNLFAPGIEFFIRANNGLFGAVNYEGQFGSMYTSNSIFGKIGIFF